MIKGFMLLAFMFAFGVVGISLYLQPDDLRKCGDYPTGEGKCVAVDAIVAVSGGDTNARADEAIRLYKNGWGKWLIFSGAALDKSGPSNAAAMTQRAIEADVDQNSILLEENSANTDENALKTDSIFSAHNIKSAILVTSGYHQRRASLAFEKNTSGVEIINHPVKEDKNWSKFWWISPKGWYLVGGELVKIVAQNFGSGVKR